MRIPEVLLPAYKDNRYHEFCTACFKETLHSSEKDGISTFYCFSCKETSPRAVIFDPQIHSWLDTENEYWHESSGVFLFSELGRKLLLFERVVFPFQWTVPSGHVDAGEDPLQTAQRELDEEVGISNVKLEYLCSEDISHDSCRRGADVHRWHAYTGVLPSNQVPVMREEGKNLSWVDITQLGLYNLTVPVGYIIEKYYGNL